jgi:hypothetical protein
MYQISPHQDTSHMQPPHHFACNFINKSTATGQTCLTLLLLWRGTHLERTGFSELPWSGSLFLSPISFSRLDSFSWSRPSHHWNFELTLRHSTLGPSLVYGVAIVNCIWFKSLVCGYTWALLNTTRFFQLHRRSLLWSHCCWTDT